MLVTSAFYAWAKTSEDTDKKLLQKQLEAKAVQLFEENRKTYGSRRLSEAFFYEGFQVGRYKAGQLMNKMGLNRATQNGSKSPRTAAIMMQFPLTCRIGNLTSLCPTRSGRLT